jgi:methionine-rich copper-binding protein CopC
MIAALREEEPLSAMPQADDTDRNRRGRMRNLLLAGIAWAAATEPEYAVAHAIIVRTSPAQGGVAETNIGKVDVWYDAGIRDAFAALAVVSASGERVDKRDAAIDSADPAHVSVSVNPLTAGKYTVRYRALSADGHLVSGAWEFEVRP